MNRTTGVECPSCGTVAPLTEAGKAADAFCAQCDFPLFWSGEAVQSALLPGSRAERRRLPGVAGRSALSSIPCPVCKEPNRTEAAICHRCGADLHPPSDEDDDADAEPVVVRLPPEPVLVRAGRVPLLAGAIAIGAGIVMLAAALVIGLWLAVDVVAPLFGTSAGETLGALEARATGDDTGLFRAVSAWLPLLGLAGLGLVAGGAALRMWAIVPNVFARAESISESLPFLLEEDR